MRNILFVADIRKDVAENGQLRIFAHRDEQAGLMHENQQPQRFHRNGLAACIGARNEENAVFAAENNRIWHDGLRVDEGMAGLDEADDSLLRNGRPAGLHLLGQLRLGKGEFQCGDAFRTVHEIVILTAHKSCQAAENTLDFLRLADAGSLQVVVGIDDSQGFDVQRRAAGRRVVDDARKGMAVFLLDRHDVAVVADRYQGVLEILLIFFILQHARYIPLRLPFQLDDAVSQAHELRRRVVANLVILVEHAGHFMRNKGKIADTFGFLCQLGIFLPLIHEILADVAVSPDVVPNIDAVLPFEGHVTPGLFQSRTDVDDAPHRHGRLALQTTIGFFRIVQAPGYFLCIAYRLEPAGNLLGHARRRKADEHVLYLIKAENTQTSFIHLFSLLLIYKIPRKKWPRVTPRSSLPKTIVSNPSRRRTYCFAARPTHSGEHPRPSMRSTEMPARFSSLK